MVSLSKKIVVVAAIALATLGCTKRPSSKPVVNVAPTAKPEPSKGDAVEATQTGKSVPSFSIQASEGWSMLSYTPLTSDAKNSELLAVFKLELDEEVTLKAGISAGRLEPDEIESYIDEIRTAAYDRENSKVFKERIYKLDGRRVYEFIDGRMTPSGPVVCVTLAVVEGKIGYVVSCGGEFEHAERIVPICAEFVEGFRPTSK